MQDQTEALTVLCRRQKEVCDFAELLSDFLGLLVVSGYESVNWARIGQIKAKTSRILAPVLIPVGIMGPCRERLRLAEASSSSGWNGCNLFSLCTSIAPLHFPVMQSDEKHLPEFLLIKRM